MGTVAWVLCGISILCSALMVFPITPATLIVFAINAASVVALRIVAKWGAV